VRMDARRAMTRPDGRNTVNDSRPRRCTLNASIRMPTAVLTIQLTQVTTKDFIEMG